MSDCPICTESYTAEEIAELEARDDYDRLADAGYIDSIPDNCEACGDALITGHTTVDGKTLCSECEWPAVVEKNRETSEWIESRLAKPEPSASDLCEHCQGKSNPYCPQHGVGASLERRSAYWRRMGGRD